MTYLYYYPAGQLHQRYLHRCVLHRSVRQTQKRQIHHAPQVSVFQASLRLEPTWDLSAWEIKACLCFRLCDRWKDIGTIAHNKSAITVEITSRDDTIIFHMVSVLSGAYTHTHTHTLVDILARVAKVCSGKWNIVRYRCDYNRIKYRRLLFVCFYLQEDMEMAKYIARLFTARHKFYKQNKICAEWVRRP